MKTAFGQEVRVLACTECAGPIEVGLEGGTVRCSYCRASLLVARRQERVPRGEPLGEAERHQELRQHVGEPLPMPTSLFLSLNLGPDLPDSGVEEAVRRWQAVRARLLGSGRGTFSLQEELFHLTRLLEPKLRHNQLKTRAVLETTLEILDDPFHEQILRALVVEDAVRGGDLRAAASWLEGLDPCSSNIHADGAYRIAAATLGAARGAADAIRMVLGDELDSVPLSFEAQAAAAVLRAHAWELDGVDDVARRQLSAASSCSLASPERRGLGYAAVFRYRAGVGLPFPLCPRTFERALREVPPARPPSPPLAPPARGPAKGIGAVQSWSDAPKTTAEMFAEALRRTRPPRPVVPPPPAPRQCPAEKISLSAYFALAGGLFFVVVPCIVLWLIMSESGVDLTSPALPWNGWILDARGVRAVAEVVTYDYATAVYESPTYHLNVRFEDNKGRTRTTWVTCKSVRAPDVPSTIQIEYDPQDRRRARLARTDPPSLAAGLLIPAGIAPGGLALFLYGLISILRQRRLYVTGTPAQARVLEIIMGADLGSGSNGSYVSRPVWHVTYDYQTTRGIYRAKSSTLSAPPARGSVVWILYDNDRPERSILA